MARFQISLADAQKIIRDGSRDAARRDQVRARASDALVCGDITEAEFEQVMVTGEAPWVTEAKQKGEPL